MRYNRRLIACLIAAFIMSAALDVLAQFPGGGGRSRGGSPGGPPPGGMQRGERPAGPEALTDLVEFRLQSFQEDLKLSPNQQKLWEPYADKVRALTGDIVRERTRAQAQTGAQLTAPQQIDHALDVARNRLTALEDVAVSAKALYEGLMPEQKLLADSRFATIVPLLAGSAQPSGAPAQMSGPRPGPDGGRGPR
jgi:hypothetical protein